MSEVLALNCGSSSLKYAVFSDEKASIRGSFDRIGDGGPSDHADAVKKVWSDLDARSIKPAAVGHRLVHGGPDHVLPTRVNDAVIDALKKAIPFAPLHLPAEIRAIEAVREHFKDVLQVACFDTAFHRTMPEVARRFPLPRALYDQGVRRYGFHGLSYEFVAETIGRGRLRRAVFAHLGSGASMVAVRDGVSIDTTMGFTPSGGLVMGTRPGDLDPGLIIYLLEHCGYDDKTLDHLVNHESGLTALSEGTSDMQQLVARRHSDPKAALAVNVFCYQARKWIGALAAALGGIDLLVFTGGIGEHSSQVRRDICRELEHLGIALDDSLNDTGKGIISQSGSACVVQAVTTDEERMVARHTRRFLRDS